MDLGPVPNALYRIKRGLAGYVSYLAACDMNATFSEYVLYEPTLRILTAQGFVVECEFPCPGFGSRKGGDFKRLDFVAMANRTSFAIEMKWAKPSRRLEIQGDLEKLKLFHADGSGNRAFLCVFGVKSRIAELRLGTEGLREQGRPVYAEFGKTRYGCRTYEVTG